MNEMKNQTEWNETSGDDGGAKPRSDVFNRLTWFTSNLNTSDQHFSFLVSINNFIKLHKNKFQCILHDHCHSLLFLFCLLKAINLFIFLSYIYIRLISGEVPLCVCLYFTRSSRTMGRRLLRLGAESQTSSVLVYKCSVWMEKDSAVAFGCVLFLRLVFGLFLLHQFLLLLQHYHDIGHLGGGDVDVLFVDQFHHLKSKRRGMLGI